MSKVIPSNIWDNEDLNPKTAAVIQNQVEWLQKIVAAEQNPFPVEVFPKPIQEIITATNESLKFPIDFIGSSILYAVSVAVGNTHRIEIMKGWQETAVLYLCLVGRAGTIKSHPLSFALKPIEQRDNLKFQKYMSEKMEYDTFLMLRKPARSTLFSCAPVFPS